MTGNELVVQALERLINNSLPNSFRQLYTIADGAEFDSAVIPNESGDWIAYSMHPKYIGVYEFFSSEEIADRIESVRSHCIDYEIAVSSEEFFLNSMMPFAEVDGYNLLCVAFKGLDRGAIFLVEWYFHHQNKETLPFPQQQVAESLEQYLNLFSDEDSNIEYQKLIAF